MSEPVTKSISSRLLEFWPKNASVWLISITCLIVLVALSRLLSLQKTVSDLQSRPVVDEGVIRATVRQHLEETVKAMEQHNKMQMQARHQAMVEQARLAQEEHARALAAIPKPEPVPVPVQEVAVEVKEVVAEEEETASQATPKVRSKRKVKRDPVVLP